MRHILKNMQVAGDASFSNDTVSLTDNRQYAEAGYQNAAPARSGQDRMSDQPAEESLFGLDGQRDIQHVPFEYLIRVRDRYLSECFDIENGRRSVIDPKQAEDRLQHLRGRIDEIHEELARRDLAQRETDEEKWLLDEMNREPTAVPAKTGGVSVFSLEAVSSCASGYLEGCIRRMDFLSDLAESARDTGDLELAAKYMLHAHEIDRDRIEMLAKLSGFGPDFERG